MNPPLFTLPPMPEARAMRQIDELFVRAPVTTVFSVVRDVERWPEHLPHYRFVRFRERGTDGGGVVEMSANRPFGIMNWPTWWLSQMVVDPAKPAVRFRHVGGITTDMDVEWRFEERGGGTHVCLLHVWNGPHWPLIGELAATRVIGPIFIHGIASRTLAGLAERCEREAQRETHD